MDAGNDAPAPTTCAILSLAAQDLALGRRDQAAPNDENFSTLKKAARRLRLSMGVELFSVRFFVRLLTCDDVVGGAMFLTPLRAALAIRFL